MARPIYLKSTALLLILLLTNSSSPALSVLRCRAPALEGFMASSTVDGLTQFKHTYLANSGFDPRRTEWVNSKWFEIHKQVWHIVQITAAISVVIVLAYFLAVWVSSPLPPLQRHHMFWGSSVFAFQLQIGSFSQFHLCRYGNQKRRILLSAQGLIWQGHLFKEVSVLIG